MRDRITRNNTLTPAALLAALAVVPALLVTAWLVAAFPLVWLNDFWPATAWPLFAVLSIVLLRFGLPPVLRASATLRVPWWVPAAVVAIAVGFMVFAAATHSEQVILARDNGSYAEIGYQLAHDGGLNKPIPAGAFGGSAGSMTYDSAAFYQVGGHLMPQFMTGWPTMVAAGWWVRGWTGELLMPALVGAAGLLAIAGLAARLVGPRWAPLAALVTALAFPVLKNSQTTFSETPALLLLLAAMYLLGELLVAADIDAAAMTRLRPWAFTAGLVLGVGELVRLDLVLDLALLMPVAAWMWATRHAGVGAWLSGALFGLGLGALDGRFLTWPYVVGNKASVKLAVAAFVVSSIVSFTMAAAVRRWGAPARIWRLVPAAGAAAVAAAGVALVVRPYVTTARGNPAGVAQYLASLQQLVGLPPDGTRTYGEQTLRWVSWYVGWPLLAAALFGAVTLTWRVLRGTERRWLPALPVYVVSAAIQMWRPSITPDHPYADRRLVVVILPGMVLLAVWTAATATRALARWVGARQRASARRSLLTPVVAATAAALAISVAFVVPAAAATAPVAAKRTEVGEVAASNAVCRSLTPARDTVVLLDGLWMATIRIQCHTPVAMLLNADETSLAKVSADIAASGRVPVIAASGKQTLTNDGYGESEVKYAVVTSTRQDAQEIVHRPTDTKPLPDIEYWYVRPRGR
ncbi:hypothetical protein [Catenulispora pinisilvae]|uniref:hypothetical protein n=1 Tax=Catenulispora pinisilvae TaxID=2705253 RepID=UPI001890C407|nr:hypothetical protein [Catenulispora pinisilvae]